MTTKHISLRLTPEMHSRLVAAADRNHRSLNGQIEEYCDRGLALDSMRGKEIYHRDGDRTSLELSSLELRDAPVMTTAAHVAAARLSEPETTETPRGEQ